MNPLLTSVATEVAQEFGSKLSRILGPTRGLSADARARAIAIAVYRESSPRGPNKTVLGRIFDRDRTTIRHALDRVATWRRSEDGFEDRYQSVLKRVQARR